MTIEQRAILEYYDFSEKCDDDIDVIVRTMKLSGCTRRPNVIKRQLEAFSCDSRSCEYYYGFMIKVGIDTIIRAKRMIQVERQQRPTLF